VELGQSCYWIKNMLVSNSKGNYRFLRGIAPYSAGAVADDGYEVIHIRFAQAVPLAEGFRRVREHLSGAKRPLHSLCGMELRSPQPFSFQGFNEFNAGYVQVLREWEIVRDNLNPVARTNVAPEIGAPSAPALYGFSYTIASATKTRTFVVAGAGELPEGSLDPHDVVRRGETSAQALREKTQFVMKLMSARLRGLGVSWDKVTTANIYAVHPICGVLESDIIRPMGASAMHGVTWHYSRPPIVSIEYEMDVRGCEHEIVLS
jgi:hypothetical protein